MNHMEQICEHGKIQRQKAPLSKSLSLSASSPALTSLLPRPNQPALNSDASMTTQVKRVLCTTTMYLATVCGCVTLCSPPVRLACLGYTLPLYVTCSSNRRNYNSFTHSSRCKLKRADGHIT